MCELSERDSIGILIIIAIVIGIYTGLCVHFKNRIRKLQIMYSNISTPDPEKAIGIPFEQVIIVKSHSHNKNCPKCLNEILKYELVEYLECGHYFHAKCVIKHVDDSREKNNSALNCPVCSFVDIEK